MEAKIKQSETVVVWRSQINFAPYNPKKHSKEQVADQKRNLKRVGFLGGIVWNKTTGNLISGHKRVMAHDEIYKYDGTSSTDYELKVEMVEFDEKTEKEQNIYMDAASTNTKQDLELLATLIPDIDYSLAGLTNLDLALIGVDMSTLNTPIEEFEEIKKTEKELFNPETAQKNNFQSNIEKEAKKEFIKEQKKQIASGINERFQGGDPYVMLSFSSFEAKCEFMRRFGFDEFEKFIKGESFSEMIERIE